MNILKKAIERLALEEAGIADAQAPEPGEERLLMHGPLGVAFTHALNIAYARPDPVTGEVPTAAVESQAIDTYLQASQNRKAELLIDAPEEQLSEDEDPESIRVYSFGVAETDASKPTVVEVLDQMKEGKVPFDMIFVQDATRPTGQSPLGGEEQKIVIFGQDHGDSYAVESFTTVVKLRKIR